MIRVLIGFISGLFSGMGIGGGAILMIFVSLFMNEKQLTAQGFNLLYFIPVALISGLVHIYKSKLISNLSKYLFRLELSARQQEAFSLL